MTTSRGCGATTLFPTELPFTGISLRYQPGRYEDGLLVGAGPEVASDASRVK